jgi:hypothetical protein
MIEKSFVDTSICELVAWETATLGLNRVPLPSVVFSVGIIPRRSSHSISK